jgi:hypothetical protein
MDITEFNPNYIEHLEIENILNEEFINQNYLKPFDEISIQFLSKLSQMILKHKGIKHYPELVALAYWLRKSNISAIINQFQKNTSKSELIVPGGLAFHIAPSNVDTIFLYSWALSLLAGNLNVVRISQTQNEQLDLLLSLIRKVLINKKWLPISKRNIVISYPKDVKINTYISSLSDLRILWGGDETVINIKGLLSKPTTKDIAFADKFSYSIINASAYIKTASKERIQIAKHFYNDSYWFNQMACSSPRFVIFSGTKKNCENAGKLFWDNLEKELKRRNQKVTIDVAMEKLIYTYETMSKTNTDLILNKGYDKPVVLRVDKNEINNLRETCGGGFFFECFANNLDELIELVGEKDQTLTYFGFGKNALKNFISKVNGKGINRIVPIGQALNFSSTWDGYSLLNEFTKRLQLL